MTDVSDSSDVGTSGTEFNLGGVRVRWNVPEEPQEPEKTQATEEVREPPSPKASYVGAPAIFELELACADLNRAFGGFGCYHVGSSLVRPDWRDVDVRYILKDDEFKALFPDAGSDGSWEIDLRWLVLTSSISRWLSARTGLPIDFQFQPQTHANARHKKLRHALGMSQKARGD